MFSLGDEDGTRFRGYGELEYAVLRRRRGQTVMRVPTVKNRAERERSRKEKHERFIKQTRDS